MKQDNRDNSRNWQTTNTGGTNYTGEIHFHGSESNSLPTRQEYRNRQALLNKVKNFWVKGVLEKSLYNQVLIELGLEERLDAVNPSWNLELQTAGEAQKPLPKGTKVISIFDQLGEGRTLLILGEPGAGKTTALLELTRDLITRTEPSLDYRIPVVLNLSSWAGKKQAIADWLVEELKSKYQIPKPIGLDWVKKQELLLLLDGLDEVKAEHRDSCVAALNDFQQNYASEMVVCSRIKDYEKLSNRLTFQSAIYLRSLTPEQVCQYLDNIKADLTGLRALIERDTALQELAKSPLMLSIMVLAYEGVAAEDLPNTDVVEERRKQLFDAYITRMFHRPTRLKVEQRYSETQSIRWLTWLAQRMVQESKTVFFIEQMQHSWFQNQLKIPTFLIEVINSAPWLRFLKEEIKPIETLNSPWRVLKEVIREYRKAIHEIGFMALLPSGTMRLLIVNAFMDGLRGPEIEMKTNPNQGIWKSALNASIIGLAFELGFVVLQLISIWRGLFVIPVTKLLIVGFIYFISGLYFGGGKACIQHFTLRLILYFNNYIPWNYARFLDYATERIFLQKVGGGYIFIHRLLLEHFAQMELGR